ncbi:MAG: PEP-CTERM sorting domain-containing protein [Terracidiphilus sp.]
MPVLALGFAPLAFADGWTIYNTIPNSLPPNLPSEPYQANSSGEFGGLIQFAGNSPSYTLTSATVAMSDWALASDWTPNGTTITASGFYVPLTLNLYDVSANNTVGALLASDSVDAFIPWRPPASAGCTGGAYLGSNGSCYNGSLSTVTFDLTGVTAPDEIIYGLAFNTTSNGTDPTGVDGPYDSLNFGLSTSPPTVGSNPLPGTAYWETTNASDYADHGAGGLGTFRQDTGWSPYSGAIDFDEPQPTPEASSLLLFGTGLLALAGIRLRKFKFARM